MITRHQSAHRTLYGRSKWQNAHVHEKYEARTKERGRLVSHGEKSLVQVCTKELSAHEQNDWGSSDCRNILVLWRIIFIYDQMDFRYRFHYNKESSYLGNFILVFYAVLVLLWCIYKILGALTPVWHWRMDSWWLLVLVWCWNLRVVVRTLFWIYSHCQMWLFWGMCNVVTFSCWRSDWF